MHRLAFNSLVLAFGAYVAQGASVLTYVLAARALGPSLFGSLSGAIGISILVAGFGDFGINGWAIRALAQRPSSIDVFKQTLTAKLTLVTVMAAAWLVISAATVGRTSLGLSVGLLAGYLLTLVLAGTLTVPFRASENMSVVSLVGAVEKLVTLAVWLAVYSFHTLRPEILLPVALVAGGAASVICAVVLVPRRFLALTSPSIHQIFDLWRVSYSFGLVGVSAGLVRADVAIVSAAAGPYAAGVYAAPARLTSFLAIIPASFSAAVFPRIARSSAAGLSRRPEFVSGLAMLAAIALLLGAFAVVAPVVIPFALGPSYLPSVSVFRIYLLAVLLNAANQPLLALLQADGFERYSGWVVVASAIFGLGAIGVGSLFGGAPGAAAGAVLLQLFQLIFFAWKAAQRRRAVQAAHMVADVVDGALDVQLFPSEVVDDSVRS